MRKDQWRDPLLAGRKIVIFSLDEPSLEAARNRETLQQFGIQPHSE